MQDDRTDAELIAESERVPESFEMVFRRHYQPIRAYLIRRAGTAVGEDLAASTFETAFDRRHTYDQSYPSARAWLFGIATNLLRHELREQRTRVRALPRLVDPNERDADLGADDRLAAEAAAGRTREALSRLNAGDREALLLYGVAGLTYAEIAVATNVPVGTVRSRIHRARTKLRELVGPWSAIMGTEDIDDG